MQAAALALTLMTSVSNRTVVESKSNRSCNRRTKRRDIVECEQKNCRDATSSSPACWHTSATPRRRGCVATSAPTSTSSFDCCVSRCRRPPSLPPETCPQPAGPTAARGPPAGGTPSRRRLRPSSGLGRRRRRCRRRCRRRTAWNIWNTTSTTSCTRSRTAFTSPALPCSDFSYSRSVTD